MGILGQCLGATGFGKGLGKGVRTLIDVAELKASASG